MRDWEEQANQLAELLTERRTPDRLGWRGEEIRAQGERTARPLELAEALGGGALQKTGSALEDLDQVEVPLEIPIAMQTCRKPFQLWNVHRQELDHDYALRTQPKFVVGRGAALAEEEQVPWRIPRATQVLGSLMADAKVHAYAARAQRDWFRFTMSSELPYGRPEPTPDEEAGRVITWNPLSGEPPPPGVRRPPGSAQP